MPNENKSFIATSSEERPEQRLYEVNDLPIQPKCLDPKVELIEPLQKHYPKASSRKLTYLLNVERAWSPMNNRIENYYLNPYRSGWLLRNN